MFTRRDVRRLIGYLHSIEASLPEEFIAELHICMQRDGSASRNMHLNAFELLNLPLVWHTTQRHITRATPSWRDIHQSWVMALLEEN